MALGKRGNFFHLLQKDGGTQKGVSSLGKGGFQPWRKLWIYTNCQTLDKHLQ